VGYEPIEKNCVYEFQYLEFTEMFKESPKVVRMVTGQRAWDPPEPIPNSEVKPRSVYDISVVFGYAKS
jgi:hypothetical protein